jgi:penicillin-binding protein 2
MANAYAIFANKGYSYTPHLVDKIVEGNGTIEKAEIKKQVVPYSKKNMKEIEKGLIQVVEGKKGTAKVLRTPGLTIAAKTGSAQNSKYKETHGWISGYFPVGNPEISFTAFVEGGGHGGGVSGEITKLFIDAYLEKQKNRNKSGIKN